MNNHRTAQIPAAAPPCRSPVYPKPTPPLFRSVEVRVCTLKSSFEDVLVSKVVVDDKNHSQNREIIIWSFGKDRKILPYVDSNTNYKSISESEMQKVCVLDSRELKKMCD
ncbi:hypothetical protein P8452_47308 [Trifolium repens]|nr:hypothetical protein P8452_47308 [Trifolium repens]